MCFAVVCNGTTPQNLTYENLSRPFNALDQAAIGAIENSYKKSNHYEFGGLLIENKKTHQYYYQIPYTDLGIDHVRIRYDVKFTDLDLKIVSEYHTHSCFPYTHVPTDFSSNDVFNYILHNQVGYMGNFCNGLVQKWDPTDIKFLEELGGNGPFGLDEEDTYEGEVVGKISLNKYPDIQESILDIPVYLLRDVE
jgi:hypothetical protein